MKHLITALLGCALCVCVLGQGRVTVVANGKKVNFPDVQPVFFGDRIMVPLRTVFEIFDAKVKWDGSSRTVTITGTKTIVLKLGQPMATVDGENVVLDTTAKLVEGGRVVVPLRFLAESLDSGVAWRSEERLITITPHR
jgi:hypothetical protein